jgi:hypothetical protein
MDIGLDEIARHDRDKSVAWIHMLMSSEVARRLHEVSEASRLPRGLRKGSLACRSGREE